MKSNFYLGVTLAVVCLCIMSTWGKSLPQNAYSSYSSPSSSNTMDVPLKGFMRVSDEVMPGMRIEKYRVPALTHWPDGRPVTEEAAPYVIIGVQDE